MYFLVKRIMAALLILILCAMMIAYGEGELWDCPKCKRTGNTGNYCGGCGHPAPWIDDTQTLEPLQTITQKPTPTSTVTTSPIRNSDTPGTSSTSMSTSEISMDIVELKTDYRGQLILHVSWNGGNKPYELSCYHYFNDEHNDGVEKCFEKVIDYGGNNVKQVGSHTTTNYLGAWIMRLMPGQRYWIVLKDSTGHEIWKDYRCPIENPTNATITCNSASFAQFQIPWEGSPGTGYHYSTEKIIVKPLYSLKSTSVDELVRKNANTEYEQFEYGFIANYTVCGAIENDYIVRYAIILPNGDEYSNYTPQKNTGATFAIQERSFFSQLLSIYNEIPFGQYTVIVEAHGAIYESDLFLE